MRTETINIYKFEELSDKAKQHIFATWRTDDESPFSGEVRATINRIETFLDIQVHEWQYSETDYTFHIWQDEKSKRLAYRVLNDLLEDSMFKKAYYSKSHKTRRRRISNIQIEYDNCPFTGVGYDCFFSDAIQELRKPENFLTWDMHDFMSFIIEGILNSAKQEMIHWHSEKGITESIECNDYEFLESGELYK